MKAGRAVASLFLVNVLAIAPALAQGADPCKTVDSGFQALTKLYLDAGAAAIEKQEPAEALEKARKAAFAGDRDATITMVGIALSLRSRQEMFHLATIRQICGFAERNKHPLHVAACAYLNALNPIGDPEQKRLLVEKELDRFRSLPEKDGAIAPHMQALEACIATRPPQ